MADFRADLHLHTVFSDGTLTPGEVASLARAAGLTHLAFTDHDTVARAGETADVARAAGFQTVTGVELSSFDGETGKKAHILGYRFDPAGGHIAALCARTQAGRQETSLRQAAALRAAGYHIPENELLARAPDGVFAQHIMAYLLETGQAGDLFGADFRRLFRNGGPCDFRMTYPDQSGGSEAVEAVKKDGGYAVLAHPGQQKNLCLLPKLAEAGLDGVELNHRHNDDETRDEVRKIWKAYGLFMAGGSDFHRPGHRDLLGAYLADRSAEVIFAKG